MMRALICLIVAATLIFNVLAQMPCNVNGCTYEAATVGSASPTITFDSTDYAYSPKCLRVASGTTVTFSGSFNGHPLYSGAYNETTSTVEAFDGTIRTTNSGDKASFEMTVSGANPYYCNYHKGSGMVGVIYVGDSCASASPSAPGAAPTTVENPTAPMSNPVAPVSNPVAAPATPNPAPKTPVTSSGVAIQIGALSLLTVLAL